jgi:hypothetical protein
MVAKIYKTKSAPNVVNKVLTEVVAFEEVIFKEDTSLLNPTIIINGVSNASSYTIEDIGTSNYFSIPKVNRYYFITDITMMSGGRVAITGKVDVLMSFKTDILGSTQLIVRQEKKTNNYLIDTDIPLSSKKQVIEHEFGDSITDSGYYILAVNGGN